MFGAIDSLKRKSEVVKSRLLFFRGIITSFYPLIWIFTAMFIMAMEGMLTAMDALDLIVIFVYSAATTFQINVLYSPERYNDSIDDMSNDSLMGYVRRGMFAASPTLLILIPALVMYAYDRMGGVAVLGLAFVTVTNLVLIFVRSRNRNTNKTKWVEFLNYD